MVQLGDYRQLWRVNIHHYYYHINLLRRRIWYLDISLALIGLSAPSNDVQFSRICQEIHLPRNGLPDRVSDRWSSKYKWWGKQSAVYSMKKQGMTFTGGKECKDIFVQLTCMFLYRGICGPHWYCWRCRFYRDRLCIPQCSYIRVYILIIWFVTNRGTLSSQVSMTE